MTLEEAIKVCEDNAEKIGGNPQSDYHAACYKQVSEWLKDYKLLRGEYDMCQLNSINDYRREAARCRAAFFKVDSQYHQLGMRLSGVNDELEEAKRLLKLAVEDLNCGSCNANCTSCNYCGSCDYDERFKWKHTDEAMKLIGGEAHDS